jgi:hypothetical protein
MKRHLRLASHYIRAHDLRVVYVASYLGMAHVGITRDPTAKAADLKRRRAKLHCAFWLVSSAAARELIAAADDAFPGIELGTEASPATVEAALPKLAGAAGLALTADDVVHHRAAAVAKDIDLRVKAMQDSGHLRGLNAEYRALRTDASKRGVPFTSYGDYLERYKIRLIYQVAEAVRAR